MLGCAARGRSMRMANGSGNERSYARVNPFIGIRCMLNIRPSGLGSTVAIGLAPVYFVNPVGPTFDCQSAALNGAFADDGGSGDGGGGAL